jgi:chitodextrinase
MTRTKRLKNVFVTAGTTLAAALIITSASLAFAADTTPPSTPTGLSASAVSLSQINLSWTASTDDVGVAGYGVFRNGLQVGTTTAISYSDSGLAAGTSYSYAVDAFDAAGNLSTQSASVSTSTLSDTTAPSVPTSLVATPVSASQINLSWSASTDNVGVTGYKVYRNGVQVGTTAATSYSDTGLAASTGYSYTVAAYDAASNTSAQSGSVSATTLTSTSTDTTAPIGSLQYHCNTNLGVTNQSLVDRVDRQRRRHGLHRISQRYERWFAGWEFIFRHRTSRFDRLRVHRFGT